MTDTPSKGVVLQIDDEREHEALLCGKHLKFLIELIKASHIKGDQVYMVADLLTRLHKPLVEAASEKEKNGLSALKSLDSL